MTATERAPAKINLCLHLGPTRASDGRHELVTVFQPLDLHDTVRLEPAPGDRDEVVCPGVEGPNLAGRALELFRAATGWDGPPVRLTIDKRIPVAGGMAGGSADAAAALRLAHRLSGLGDEALLLEVAFRLGADVPGQLRPRQLLGTGAGETLEEVDLPCPPVVAVLPSTHGLSTGAVFQEADRLGLQRDAEELRRRAEELRAGHLELVNDLEPAACSLLPELHDTLDRVRAAGGRAMVSGSGPTVLGFFADAAAAAALGAPILARPL